MLKEKAAMLRKMDISLWWREEEVGDSILLEAIRNVSKRTQGRCEKSSP